jgi:hypothetical protein
MAAPPSLEQQARFLAPGARSCHRRNAAPEPTLGEGTDVIVWLTPSATYSTDLLFIRETF